MKAISIRTRAVLAGVFIITAYAVLLSALTDSSPTVLLIDLVSGLSVIGIALLLYPVFKGSGKILSSFYLILKVLEGVLMFAAGVFFLFSATASYRAWMYEGVQLYTFLISALLLYILVYKSRIIPRFIAIWGYAAVAIQSLSAILGLLNAKPAFLDIFLVLMITNEVFMAGWLIIKGIKTSPEKAKDSYI